MKEVGGIKIAGRGTKVRILAFDTATSACSAALWEDGAVRARRFENMTRGHAEVLMPMIADVIDEAGTDFSRLDLIAVTVGPGAFTGMRIGLATARGMALAAAVPCLGVTTLEAVAEGVQGRERAGATLLVVLSTKRQDVYAQAFDTKLVPVAPPRAVLPGELVAVVPAGRVVVAGDAAGEMAALLMARRIDAVPSAAAAHPDAARVAAIAARRWTPGDVVAAPAPLYLRPPDAEIAIENNRRR